MSRSSTGNTGARIVSPKGEPRRRGPQLEQPVKWSRLQPAGRTFYSRRQTAEELQPIALQMQAVESRVARSRVAAKRTAISDRSDEQGTASASVRQLAFLPVEQLKPDPRNPRKHHRAQVQAIARSIRDFGFNAPILVDGDDTIIAGHGRLEGAKLAGITHVPVIRLEHLTPAQASAYMLADNKLTDRSDWDSKLLALRFKELSELVLDFSIESTGFELPEIDLHIQSLDDPDIADKADTFAIATGPAVSRVGDVWHLGEHRVVCGNALEVSSYQDLLGAQKAAAVVTDPPYNVPIDGHVGGKGAVKHREFVMAAGEMSQSAFTTFLRTACAAMGAHSAQGAVVYAFMDWRHMGELMEAAQAAHLDLINLCIWVKANGGMGSLYRSRHELVFVFRNGATPHRNNVQLGRFGRNRTNVWNYPGANSFARKGRQSGLDHHPTSKPVALVADAILDVTTRGDIVLDPFLGAGTTILAAERTGRRAYAIEIDPLYVDTAIRRWEAMTGKKATHPGGASFADVRLERVLPA